MKLKRNQQKLQKTKQTKEKTKTHSKKQIKHTKKKNNVLESQAIVAATYDDVSKPFFFVLLFF